MVYGHQVCKLVILYKHNYFKIFLQRKSYNFNFSLGYL